ncbi:MAG: PadR family transcriptional regulator [Candidatus Asgardarchaeia archaeon]
MRGCRRFTDLGRFQLEVLSLLSEKSLHGYDIKRILGKVRGKEPSSGILYPTLERLESRGLIRGVWIRVKNKYRKVYTITEKGREKLDTFIDLYRKFRYEVIWGDTRTFWEKLLSRLNLKDGQRILISTLFPSSLMRWFNENYEGMDVYLHLDEKGMLDRFPIKLCLLLNMEKTNSIRVISDVPKEKFDRVILMVKPLNSPSFIKDLTELLIERGLALISLTKKLENIWLLFVSKMVRNIGCKAPIMFDRKDLEDELIKAGFRIEYFEENLGLLNFIVSIPSSEIT